MEDLDHGLDRFRVVLERRFGHDLITLAKFGSRAQGKARPESDLDLLLIARGDHALAPGFRRIWPGASPATRAPCARAHGGV